MEKGCDDMSSVLLAVNGTLMRGLELEKNLLDVGAVFRYEAKPGGVTVSGASGISTRP